jgi:hypothetical protein
MPARIPTFLITSFCLLASTSTGCRRVASVAGEAAGSASHAHSHSLLPPLPPEPAQPQQNAFVAQFGRQQQVLGALEHTNAVRSCWESALLRDPAHPAESLHVQLNVDDTGRAQVAVSGAGDESLGNCIRSRATSQSYGVGGQVATEAVFNLAPGG